MDSACVDETNIITTGGTTHQFKINYFKIKDMSNDQSVVSSIFRSEGYEWIIRYYPNGCFGNDYVVVFLELVSDCTTLIVDFTLAIFGDNGSKLLHEEITGRYKFSSHGLGHRFALRSIDIEERYLTKEGYFYIACSIKEICQDDDRLPRVPIDNIEKDISELWESQEMTDVNFEVEGTIISAHRVILAARSKNFKIEFLSHKEKTECIKIENMKPEVFRAMLHFVYSNLLDNVRDTPQITSVMTQQLLTAAHRYAIKGLMVRCEDYLMKNLSVDTVLDILFFATEYHHSSLKEACLEFASRYENFTKLVLTDGYNQMPQTYPSLWVELQRANFKNFLTPSLYLYK